jgi:hypothetical protein
LTAACDALRDCAAMTRAHSPAGRPVMARRGTGPRAQVLSPATPDIRNLMRSDPRTTQIRTARRSCATLLTGGPVLAFYSRFWGRG